MIDPSDRLLETYRRGDADIAPGSPTGGEWGEIPDPQPLDQPRRPDMFMPFMIPSTAFATGAVVTLDAGLRPAYWLVSLDATANGEAWIYPDERPAGAPMRVGPSQTYTLPGVTQFLTLVSRGAGAPYVYVQAVEGHLAVVGSR